LTKQPFDYGFTSHSEDELKPVAVLDTRAKEICDIVLPLIVALSEDADKKDYIKWPNRKKPLKEMHDKIKQILNQ